MPSEENRERDRRAETAEQDHRALRPSLVKADRRDDRLSSDHIHLSPRAQRRMAMGRRSGF